MKVDLSIKERILVGNVLPQAKSLASMRIVQDLRNRLVPTLEEYEAWGIVETPGRVEWKVAEAETVKEFELARKESDLIVEALRDLDQKEQVTAEYLPLFDKFEVE